MKRDKDFPIKATNCLHCGEEIDCFSNAQKFCKQGDNPSCYDDRFTRQMSDRKFAKYRGVDYEYLKKLLE